MTDHADRRKTSISRRAAIISLLIPAIAFCGSSIHAQSRRKAKTRRVQPYNTQPICTGTASIAKIGPLDAETLRATGTLGCNGNGSTPCNFAVVAALWMLEYNGWNLLSHDCSDYVITCNTSRNFSLIQATAGLAPGSYRWDVGIYTGSCRQNGTLWATKSFNFTVIQ